MHNIVERAVLLASMEHLLTTLAACAAGVCPRADIELLVMHLWDNRSLGRRLFTSGAARPIVSELASAVREKTGWSPLVSSGVANGYIGGLAGWLGGETRASRDEVMDWLKEQQNNSDR